MNYPKTADEWIVWRSYQRARQVKINQEIKLALDQLVRLDADMLVGYWDDYLHSPKDIDGIELNRRWNKITLAAMLEDIKISIG